MINRLLEKKVELIPDDEIISCKYPIKLEYYLIESDIDGTEELNGKKAYGIEIIKKVDGMHDEMETVHNFSCCREITEGILEKLASNLVTPVGLPFILDDLMGL